MEDTDTQMWYSETGKLGVQQQRGTGIESRTSRAKEQASIGKGCTAMRVVLNAAAVVSVCAALQGLVQFAREPSVVYLALAAAALGLGLCALLLARRYGPEPVVFYVVAAYLVWQATMELHSAVLVFANLSTRSVPDPTLSGIARSCLLRGGLELGLAACIFFLARRYGAKPDRVVQPSRNEKSYVAMRVVFYVVAVMLIYTVLPAVYLFWLAGRCKEEPGRDVRPYIRQGGFVLLGLGVAVAGFSVWSAMPYFRGESCSMAAIGLLFAPPVVVLLYALGVVALVQARR